MLLPLASCEKDFLIDEFIGENKTTINCLFDIQNRFQVFVTQSSHPTQNNSTNAIQDATIELFENGSLVETIPYTPSNIANTFGSYQSTLTPIAGNSYTIKVARPGKPDLTAQDTMPQLPQVNDYKVSAFATNATKNNVEFSFSLTDQNPNLQDYYRIETYHTLTRWVKSTPTDSSLKTFTTDVRPFALSALADTVDDHGWSYLFSDKDFNGSTKNITVGFPAPDTAQLTTLSVIVYVIKVSQNHWNYFRTLEQFNNSNKDTDPAPVFSNITNGYGIFMGQNTKNLIVQIK